MSSLSPYFCIQEKIEDVTHCPNSQILKLYDQEPTLVSSLTSSSHQ